MNVASTLTLSKEDIAIAVKEYLERKGYNVLSDISFIVSSHLEGYGRGEYEVTGLEGASCRIEI